jgi:hypothetical protein
MATYIKSTCTECTETLECFQCEGDCGSLGSIFGASAMLYEMIFSNGCVQSGVVFGQPDDSGGANPCAWYSSPSAVFVQIALFKNEYGECTFVIEVFCSALPYDHACYAFYLTTFTAPLSLPNPITLTVASDPYCDAGSATITFSHL